MNGFSQGNAASSLAIEQQSWARQIDQCLQSVAQSAHAADDSERPGTQEGWQLIERALRMGADVLKSMPQLAG
jgi:hypothetical protein